LEAVQLKILARQHRHQLLQSSALLGLQQQYYMVSSLHEPLFVLVPIHFSPSLEAPRLHALETRDLHQHNRKKKVVIIKIRRYKRLVLGFVFLHLKTDMILGDGVGASLVMRRGTVRNIAKYNATHSATHHATLQFCSYFFFRRLRLSHEKYQDFSCPQARNVVNYTARCTGTTVRKGSCKSATGGF